MNKKIFPLFALSALLFACGGESGTGNDDNDPTSSSTELSSGEKPSSGSLSSNAPVSSGEQASSETDATSSSKPSSNTLVSSATGSSSSTKPASSGTTSSTILSSATGPSSSAKLSSSKPSSSATTPSSSAGTLPPGSTFTDPRDGQIYNIVQIGTQVWFAENLNFGTQVSSTTNSKMKDDAVHEKFCYQDVAANCDIYGGMYQWNELMDLPGACRFLADSCLAKLTPDWQGICPDGWHVPDTTDFMILIRKAQTEHPAQGNAALRDESYGTPQSPGLDSYGFAMLGSGRRLRRTWPAKYLRGWAR